MKNAAYFLFPILIVAACFLGGCSSTPPPSSDSAPVATHTTVNVGMTASTVEEEYQNFSFEEVAYSVSVLGFDPYVAPAHGMNQTTDKHIMLIRGEHLDESARATSWLFIVRHDNKTSFVTYDHLGETVLNWAGSSPKVEIFPDQIVPPGTLFDMNRAEIFRTTTANSTESRTLELTGGNYTLTITGQGAPRILVFDAKSGALRSSK